MQTALADSALINGRASLLLFSPRSARAWKGYGDAHQRPITNIIDCLCTILASASGVAAFLPSHLLLLLLLSS